MREKSGYRETLADLLEYTGGVRIISAKGAGAYLGIDYRTAQKRYGIGKEGIVVTKLAAALVK